MTFLCVIDRTLCPGPACSLRADASTRECGYPVSLLGHITCCSPADPGDMRKIVDIAAGGCSQAGAALAERPCNSVQRRI
jgi:hypothetical protein